MTGDGASTISGLSIASSSGSRRFRLLGLGKRRYKKKDIVGESFDTPAPLEVEETQKKLEYGYGHGNEKSANYEQAPRDRYYEEKHFEPVMEVENSSNF